MMLVVRVVLVGVVVLVVSPSRQCATAATPNPPFPGGPTRGQQHRRQHAPAFLPLAAAPPMTVLSAVRRPSTTPTTFVQQQQQPQQPKQLLMAAATSTQSDVVYNTLFNFTSLENQTGTNAVACFERIDDAIMGGISTSRLQDVPNTSYASWSGVCRLDGGGFCGMRTLPLREPIATKGYEGIFVKCRLASDDEPQRRVWKVSARTDTSRGEVVYQAPFTLMPGTHDWQWISVPFDSFVQVRGPRLIPNAPPMFSTNTTTDKRQLYQVGLTMSQFVLGVNMTSLENFRPGYFELQIEQMGLYRKTATPAVVAASTAPAEPPAILSWEERRARQPRLLRWLLFPLLRLFFSEARQRRKSARRLMQQEWKLSRWGALRFTFASRAHAQGVWRAGRHVTGILVGDALRTIVLQLLRLFVLLPILAVVKSVRFLTTRLIPRLLSTPKPPPPEVTPSEAPL